ncbi:MAG: FliG C-terminal domain-containing protein [Spirochaetales bacterium]|nr:FliG C-terminal domain-containing protein [Spirochaetales bacterium]
MIECSEEEKESLLPLLKEILKVAKRGRVSGFLDLAKESDSINNPFLSECVQLLGNGYESRAIEKIIDIRIAVKNIRGLKLIEMSMVREGILSIMRGDPQALIEEILFSFLGKSIHDKYLEERKHNFNSYIEKISKGEKTAKSDSGKWILNATSEDISKMLKAIDWESLGLILKTETDAVLHKIINSISADSRKVLYERLEMIASPDKKLLLTAENRFKSITAKIKARDAKTIVQ